LFTAWVVFIPIDVFHLQLMPVVPPWLSVCGAAMALGGFGIMFTALRQNAYAAPIVGDQSERGQVLVDTGLYGRIRHPMYTGTLLFLAGIALWLQSFASVLTLSIGFAPIIARIFVEERALRETLPGYVEYMSRVRYRLVPYVW
jgi:protein-S-isoprenylcysteine O-methyltransferase Ste14